MNKPPALPVKWEGIHAEDRHSPIQAGIDSRG
jgi:hypothetical protein